MWIFCFTKVILHFTLMKPSNFTYFLSYLNTRTSQIVKYYKSCERKIGWQKHMKSYNLKLQSQAAHPSVMINRQRKMFEDAVIIMPTQTVWNPLLACGLDPSTRGGVSCFCNACGSLVLRLPQSILYKGSFAQVTVYMVQRYQVINTKTHLSMWSFLLLKIFVTVLYMQDPCK